MVDIIACNVLTLNEISRGSYAHVPRIGEYIETPAFNRNYTSRFQKSL